MPGCQDCACALLSFGPDKDSIEGRSVAGCQDCACALLSFGPDKDSIEGRSVVGSAWMSGLRLRVVIVWAAVVRVVLRLYKYITVPYSFVTLIGRAPPALHLRSYNIVHLCVLIVG